MENHRKVLTFSAPSGCGKSTLINHLMTQVPDLHFSISCTSRPPRGTEQNGVEYFFLTPEDFRAHIAAGDFLEYEEVYAGRYYGTLRQQVDAQLELEHVVCDVDVLGGENIKKHYGERCLSLFIMPPSVQALRERLERRGTDSPEVIDDRLKRAEFEISHAGNFDIVIVNDDLETAKREVVAAVRQFLER